MPPVADITHCQALHTSCSVLVSQVRQWVRSPGAAEIEQRMIMDPMAVYVKAIFSLLQSIQVMHPGMMGPCACILRWDDSNWPEIVRTGWSSFVGPDIYSFKHAEASMFEKLFVQWDQPNKGQYSLTVAATGDDLADMLIALSGGRSFLSEPDGFDSLSEIAWLRNLSQFTFGQYIAGALELSLWRAFNRRNEPLTRQPPSTARSCIHQLLEHHSNGRDSTLCLVYQQGFAALRELMTCDSGLLSFFVTIMKPRVKLAEDSLTCSYLSAKKQDCLRLWAAATAAASWLRSVHLFKQRVALHQLHGDTTIEKWSDAVLNNFLNIPFFEMNSFTLEHKLRTKDSLWHKGTLLMSEMLMHPMGLQSGLYITAATTSKAKTKKKPKSKQRLQRCDLPASPGAVKLRECSLTPSRKTTEVEVNMPLARGSVPSYVVEKTQVSLLFLENQSISNLMFPF